KPLPVTRHGIRRSDRTSPSAELKERDRRARLEALATSYRRSHQLSIARVVEQLPPIPPPAGIVAPAGRDLPLADAPGEALHVDLIPVRRIRGISQPSPVGRERPRLFTRFRVDHGIWLHLATPPHRQNPDILFRLRVKLPRDNEATVPRPVGGNIRVIRFHQRRLLSVAAYRLLIEVPNHIPIRNPNDTATVRRPDGIHILRWIEGEALRVAPRYVIQPEVECAGLGIRPLGDKTLFVRREPDLVNTCSHVQRVE